MPVYTDQLNRIITIDSTPKRIVSLVPSQTELLHHFNLNDEVIGITKFCIHPDEWFRNKQRVGGTKQINFEKLKALNPDLIIANKEENDELQLKQLMVDYKVWVSDIKNLDDALHMIHSIGNITGKKHESKKLISEITKTFEVLRSEINVSKKRVCYLIWYNPIMAAASGTFINDMIERSGFENALKDKSRYPLLSVEDLKQIKPELIFLSSEPFPFKQKHIDELKNILPESRFFLVNGELFSWYGSRLLQSAEYFKKLREEIDGN